MASNVSLWGTLTTPLIRQNPVTLQILGICSALAVTTSLDTALTMSISLTVVVVLAAGIISAIRRHIPNTIRIIVQIIIVASLVIVIDQLECVVIRIDPAFATAFLAILIAITADAVTRPAVAGEVSAPFAARAAFRFIAHLEHLAQV